MRRSGAGIDRHGRGGLRTPRALGGYSPLAAWSGSIIHMHDLAQLVQTSGGLIDSIGDMGPNANIVTAAGAARPTFNAADANFNGQPSMTGDGVDDQIGNNAVVWTGGNYNPGTTVLVCRLHTNVNGNQLYQLGLGGAAYRNGQNSAQRVNCSWQGATAVNAEGFVTTTRSLVGVYSGGFGSRYIGNVLSGGPLASILNAASPNKLSLLATDTPSAWSHASIAFAASLNRALTPAELLDFNTYAVARWGTS